MLIPTRNILKRVLALQLAGTRGGPVRLQILLLLDAKPRNINEIAKRFGLDYKTVQHHIRVLQKSDLIASSHRKYGNTYTLSTLLKSNKDILKEIMNMGKSR